MITQLPEDMIEPESGTTYREVLHGFLDMRCKNLETGEVSGDPFDQCTIPIALVDCAHVTTVCNECLWQWKKDYDIAEDYLA